MNEIDEPFIAKTIDWLERMVIGLNLCPFAKAIHVKKQIRFVVSHATNSKALLEDLEREFEFLLQTNPDIVETTLLIHPKVLHDFMDYNAFLAICDLKLEELELDGIIQIASFHPSYQFADTQFNDVTNYTNRSPFPTLHLLREESVELAIESIADPSEIYNRNIETMTKIGKSALDAMR